jgi:biopolymer transport protein ExbB
VGGVSQLLEQTGWVGGPIVFVCFSIWLLVALRLQRIGRGAPRQLRPQVASALAGASAAGRGVLQEFIREGAQLVASGTKKALPRIAALAERSTERLAGGRALLRVLVTVAPLLGLLGTVDGMIEMFGALHGAGGVRVGEGTVADGISRALLSTQLGLVIGIPGLLAARFAERLEERRCAQIETVRALLAQGVVPHAEAPAKRPNSRSI